MWIQYISVIPENKYNSFLTVEQLYSHYYQTNLSHNLINGDIGINGLISDKKKWITDESQKLSKLVKRTSNPEFQHIAKNDNFYVLMFTVVTSQRH